MGAFGEGEYGLSSASMRFDPSDQFFFDLTLCSCFSLLADARLSREDSGECARRLGVGLLQVVPAASSLEAQGSLTALLAGVRALLGWLKAVGYVREWSLDDSDADDAYLSESLPTALWLPDRAYHPRRTQGNCGTGTSP